MPGAVTGGVVKAIATGVMAGVALFGPAAHARADSPDPTRTYAVAIGTTIQAPCTQPANGHADLVAGADDQYQWDTASPGDSAIRVAV